MRIASNVAIALFALFYEVDTNEIFSFEFIKELLDLIYFYCVCCALPEKLDICDLPMDGAAYFIHAHLPNGNIWCIHSIYFIRICRITNHALSTNINELLSGKNESAQQQQIALKRKRPWNKSVSWHLAPFTSQCSNNNAISTTKSEQNWGETWNFCCVTL